MKGVKVCFPPDLFNQCDSGNVAANELGKVWVAFFLALWAEREAKFGPVFSCLFTIDSYVN